MMGIGTPSRKSKIERIVFLLDHSEPPPFFGGREDLDKLYVIALPASDRGGIARAKSANEQSNK
jgi:hypothetical protein